jgi:hypothetical protein
VRLREPAARAYISGRRGWRAVVKTAHAVVTRRGCLPQRRARLPRRSRRSASATGAASTWNTLRPPKRRREAGHSKPVADEADHDIVQFEHAASGATRMTVALAYPEEPDDAVVVTSIRISLAGDLACFREGAESGHRCAA